MDTDREGVRGVRGVREVRGVRGVRRACPPKPEGRRRARGTAGIAAVLLATAVVGAGCRKSDSPPGSGEPRSAAAVAAGEAAGGAVSPAGPGNGSTASAAGAAADAAAAAPPVRAGCAGAAAKRIPEAADPAGGTFTLEDAVEGLADEGSGLAARLETTAAVLRCVLDAEGAPATVANFVGLARGLRPWWDPCRGEWVREPMYDGMPFHKLEPGFAVQTGCPIGDGTGGPGYAIADELGPGRVHDEPGVLSMANVGAGTAGSQFFVTLGPAPALDRRFTAFGRCGPADELGKLDEAARGGREVRVVRVTIERTDGAGGER
ncbi:MAG: peptidylprolyl isomerase [Deltaproteobacteria bacterium]|nr:peptidylprolyl isomerase [Deltaproteobacteria bacterium]